jgi:hypothetical protein
MSRRIIFAWLLALVVTGLHIGWLLRPLLGIGDWRMANLSGTLPLVQIALIVGWMVFGPGRLPLRLAGVLLLFLIDQAWLASSRMYLYFYADLTMAVGCGVLAASVACWLGGWRVIDNKFADPNDAPPPLQFSIRTLLTLMTVAAIATLTATAVYRRSESPSNFTTLLRISVLAAGYSLAFLLTARWVLCSGRWWLRVAAAGIMVPSSGALAYFLLRANNSAVWGAYWFTMTALVLALSLLPIRLLGYRFARIPWRKPNGRDMAKPTG